ncbi:MAG: LytTR family transcriptional regulator [Prevotellaceae bacterium]|nr:LytTR family transcriptional regulator [Prevotellaceae bacterium]
MSNVKYLYLNTRTELYRIETASLAYFEADGNYTSFYLRNQKRGTVTMNLARMQELLDERMKGDTGTFARVGKRHIINLAYVYHIDLPRQRLTLSDGCGFTCTLDISKEALRQLKDLFVAAAKTSTKPCDD